MVTYDSSSDISSTTVLPQGDVSAADVTGMSVTTLEPSRSPFVDAIESFIMSPEGGGVLLVLFVVVLVLCVRIYIV